MTVREPIDDNGISALPGLGPTPGDRYRNRHANVIATVVAVQQRRYAWVLLRWNDREEEFRLDEFERYWRPL